jgi:sigma-B regulation protein RsbU (phosphoserine phosphatase)
VTENVVNEIAEELELERNILRELLKQAPTAVIVMWGPELRFRYVSERALDFLPRDRELIDRPVTEVFPNAEEAIEDVRSAVVDRGETVEVHDVPLASDEPGAWEGNRYYTFIASPVEGPDGMPAGVLNLGFETTSDVRARKNLERELATEQRIANQLQVSLMPATLPDVPGVDLASGFRPAGDGHEIGGDFYDVFRIDESCWMVVIGDVCGKGAEAAAITALARYTMRAAAIGDGANPCTVLARLNEALLRQSEDLRFVSAVCGFLYPLEGGGVTLSLCVAGHMPPLRVDTRGAVTRIAGGHGVVLGIWEQPDLEQERVELAVGERLVLYTDGVLDADPEQELTEEGFAEMLGRACQGAAAETVTLIEREVVQGGALRGRDDVAVLVIRPDGAH